MPSFAHLPKRIASTALHSVPEVDDVPQEIGVYCFWGFSLSGKSLFLLRVHKNECWHSGCLQGIETYCHPWLYGCCLLLSKIGPHKQLSYMI